MANTQVDITQNGTTTLVTAGKYCDRNIDVNVNVGGAEQPTEFTNVLKHPSTVVVLNANASVGSGENVSNGEIIVYIDLVGLGFTTHPAELTIRWRGMDMSMYTALYLSTDKSTWSAVTHLYESAWDEHGDRSLYRKVNYPTSNRYLKVSFKVKGNAQVITQEDVDKCILTINEPIGNGGYV